MKKLEDINYIEKVIIIGQTGEKKLYAKFDTGADRNSVDFQLAGKVGLGPVTGSTKVRGQKRALVMAKIVIRNRSYPGKVSLSDRSGKNCKILIGRDIIKDNYRVIVTSKSRYDCKRVEE